MPTSRWDRPAPPRDWRWVVGGIGRVLVATGLLMFGFVAYQLWGTGLEYAQAQDRLAGDFAQLLAAAPAPTATTDPAAVASTVPAPTTAPVPGSAPPSTAPPSAPSTAPVTSDRGLPVPDFEAGDVMAKLEIPAIGVDTYIVSGVQPGDLKQGPGHYPDTPMPGQLGNSAVAGHRTTYGQPFYRLDEVEVGDEIVVSTVQGRFVYRATGREVVGPGRSDVVATTDHTTARLTLTTCDPKYTARNRLILYAELDPAASAAPQPPVIEADRPAVSAPPAPPSSSAAPDDPVVSGPPATDAVPPTTTAATVPAAGQQDEPSGDVTGEIADAFAHGWFSDDAAFAQIALWGSIVSAVSIGAWLLSRQVRRDWVGALVGIVPFLVALYFLFQNVNRLLPAAL